ncbi:MAG: methyltransferase family protein, partial [Pseudonocardiaceae bacterium]
MTPEATLARFREYMVGPVRFMNLLSCFELGIIDTLRENPGMTAAKLGDAVGAKPDAVEQLLQLLVKESFLSYDAGSGGYSLDALAGVAKADLQRALNYMNLIKVIALRQVFYLTDSVRTGTLVGLNKLYGFDGNLAVSSGGCVTCFQEYSVEFLGGFEPAESLSGSSVELEGDCVEV